MYTIDQTFTNDYLKALKNFSAFVVQRYAELPQTRNDQLYHFFSDLHTKLGRVTRKRRALVEDISINPNIIFQYNNPKGGGRKFYVSLGGTVKFQNGIIIEQCLVLNLMLEHTEECAAIPEGWDNYPIENGYHILRRFHFDVDTKNDDISKPKFHLQYGGNFEPKYLEIDNVHYKLFSPIDHPRLPQQPYDIIMLFDFMLKEFALGGVGVINDSGWNKHVIESERIWLKPYYETLLDRLSSTSRRTPIHRLN
ncbi:hypothetical protein [Enterovibrio norvegicus]|uniref:hypothetical protein n=1 Tax=Enterovibrio norvegicus TaxID=188144 RepID=UPI000C834A66|nr:hypothetical protein [Enterovibrio norvegicus]PMN69682.1 hypothetical protein BCT27_20325 [Enterovibrio norvegicus]